MSAGVSSPSGWLAPIMASLFPADLHGVPRGTGPRSLAIPGSSSRELGLLSRVRRRSHPPAAAAARRLPWGPFALHRGIDTRSPLAGRIPLPAYVPPSVFLTPSTVSSSAHLAGLFHPATTSEICSSGAFPAGQPPWLFTSACPRVVAAVRLQPGHPGRSGSRRPAFRALIQPSIRCHRQGFYACRRPIPS